MSLALLLLLIAQSNRRPTEHDWCRDDEDVSHNRPSIRRILNETKCHTTHVVGPPLESVGATFRIHSPHRVKCHTTHAVGGHLLNLWGYLLYQPSEQSTTWSKVPHHTRGRGHLLNLWGPPLESKGLLSPSCLYRLVLV